LIDVRGVNGPTQVARQYGLPMEVPQEHADHAATIAHPGPLEVPAAVRDEATHHHRGQGVQHDDDQQGDNRVDVSRQVLMARRRPCGREGPEPRENRHATAEVSRRMAAPNDPALNPLYRDLLAHDGPVALPCGAGDSDRKGKVGAGIGRAQRAPLKGIRFEALEAACCSAPPGPPGVAEAAIHPASTSS
jgi:hypothetical protein